MSKEKPKKYKHLKKKEPIDLEEEATTIISNPDARTHSPTQTSMPMLKKQPHWVYRSGSNKVAIEWGIVGVVIILNTVW